MEAWIGQQSLTGSTGFLLGYLFMLSCKCAVPSGGLGRANKNNSVFRKCPEEFRSGLFLNSNENERFKKSLIFLLECLPQ
jgi:hypothetical protein